MDTKFIRDRITQLRIQKGVSEYKMSYDLGHSRSYIYNISSGKSLPPMAEFLEICDYFGITPSQFFNDTSDNPVLLQSAIEELKKLDDDDLMLVISNTRRLNKNRYVLHRAMAQRKTIERARMALSPDDISSERDVIINFFGSMEIYTSAGIWKEQDFKSPKCSRVVAYLLLQRKAAHSALGIADALYPEDDIDPETINQNIRSYMYRFRRSLEPIFKHQLIEYTANGYRINPNINIMTDLQKFDRLWEQAQKNIPVSHKAHLLKRAIHLYRGTVFETACDDHWLVGIATEYKLKYIGLVNELLALLAKYDDYNGINTFATQALKLTPENIKAYYWLIYAMYHSGAIELAKNEAQRAKSILTSEEYTTLKKYLLQDETLAYSQLFAA